LALLEVKGSIGDGGGLGVVGDHHDGFAVVLGEGGEEGENGAGGFAIEVAGGFIGDEEFGVVHDGPSDGDPLFLAAGKFGGAVLGAIGKPHEVEGNVYASPAFGAGEGHEEEGQFHVLEGRENRHQMVELEDVADVT
jgi:hypothetical protein